ncbi:MAG: type II toxin-antitoxin system death-on-curing family toxin [Ignavibacteriaceae bacterium]|nr:type II toxin-antitoxin system death-on-curing family toxin [Ignavibacteriaceae bacterium]
MRYLTPEQVLFIHARVIAETGGEHGLRDLGLLQSAVARPQAVFDGKELYPDIHYKVAALLESLINNHPFVDGNKRTGITAAAMFLRINGYSLSASNEEVVSFVLSIASGEQTIETIAEWLKSHRIIT